MDAGVPATWIIAIACTTLTAVVTAVVIALAAYKIGRLTEKLQHKSEPLRDRWMYPPMPPYDSGSKREREKEESKKKEEKEKEKEKKEEAKTKKVEDDDWEWPIYDQHYSRTTHKTERKLRSKEKIKPTDAPFEVTYEQRRSRPATVAVKLLSKPLIEIARRALTKHGELLTVQEPEIDAKHMFIALSALKNDTDRSPPLRHLIRFLETEYKDVIVHTARMAREKTVSWGLLWAFLHKGEKVTYTCAVTGQTLQGVVQYVHYSESETKGNHMTCFLDCYDWNGVRYTKGRTSVKIEEFQNERSFEAIGICPMALLDAAPREDMEAMLLRNGRKFYKIVSNGSCYMDYEGSIHQMARGRNIHGTWQLQKSQADGRVMVDLRSFARMCPGYPLQNAEPPSATSPQSLVTGPPTDEELMLAPAVVYGFSFSTKLWGAFDVNGFSEIAFDDQAFDRDLVLTDPTSKDMLLALVSQYVKDDVPKLDPISKKGEGCVFLCYGPPGTGKTLTAESIAEKLHRPLWSISVFELGTNANQLEANLVQILDIASQWRAVLLLDEADVYMEKRTSSGDPSRTAMTAIFLRLMEYYRGVLFLTTNRVAAFDDAFCSRISMFLRYHRLEGTQREAVWGNLFARAGVETPDLAPFLETRLNGREIRNTIRIAQTWARSSDDELTTDHVLRVVNMLGGFRKDLEGAIRDEGDERFITRAVANVRDGTDAPLNGHFVEVSSVIDDEED